MYIISNDLPEEQVQLYNDLEHYFGYSVTFVSDPDMKLIEILGMDNTESAYRGYALMDEEGKVIFNSKNDYWGDQFDQTVEEIKEEYAKLTK